MWISLRKELINGDNSTVTAAVGGAGGGGMNGIWNKYNELLEIKLMISLKIKNKMHE